MKIIIDDKIPFLKGVFDNIVETQYLKGSSITKENIKNADALIVRTRTRCNKDLLENSSVKMVATATVGIDHFDIQWLEKEGIKWSNAPGCNSGSVYQYVASVLSLLIQNGLNPNKTIIGIVGVGMVGSKVEKLAKTLGFKVLLNDPPRARIETNNSFSDLKTVYKEADIITFHTPLTFEGTDATFHLFDNNSLDMVKSGSIIINTSRGEVIDSHALLKGIKSGKISKAVLDVWENEPDISPELLEKVWVATPHIAGYSIDGKANGTKISVQAISRFFNLGFDNWQPQSLPKPENPIIKICESNKQPFQIVAEVILKTYNVLNDDKNLRKDPSDFEKLRNNYPARREFEAWEVQISQENNCWELLMELGFTNFYKGTSKKLKSRNLLTDEKAEFKKQHFLFLSKIIASFSPLLLERVSEGRERF